MEWFFENIDMKLQKEEINEKNIKRKKIELYNRFIDYLNKYKNDELPSKEEINSNFIKKLDRLQENNNKYLIKLTCFKAWLIFFSL